MPRRRLARGRKGSCAVRPSRWSKRALPAVPCVDGGGNERRVVFFRPLGAVLTEQRHHAVLAIETGGSCRAEIAKDVRNADVKASGEEVVRNVMQHTLQKVRRRTALSEKSVVVKVVSKV